jgi:hypothetical protein
VAEATTDEAGLKSPEKEKRPLCEGARVVLLSLAPTLSLLIGVVALLAAGPVRAVQFNALTDLQTGIGFTTVLAFGPEDPDPLSNADGCIYAVHGSNGSVSRVCFDATKTVTSNTVVIDINGAGSVNNVLGITIDPDSDPAGEIHVYLGYSDNNGGPFEGKIARAVSTDGGVSFITNEDFITGLGRSAFDHQTNGLDFGPDNCLYVSQGNNSNGKLYNADNDANVGPGGRRGSERRLLPTAGSGQRVARWSHRVSVALRRADGRLLLFGLER